MGCSLENGHLIRTFSGRELNPFNLHFEEIVIEDIAHSLACLNRFCGHTFRPISVAQHSVFVARLCEGTGFELKALLDDAAEAYLGEVTRWVKRTPEFAAYRECEKRAQETIWARFGCPEGGDNYIESADRIMVRYEGMKGFGPEFAIDAPGYEPLTPSEIEQVGKWSPWSWREAEEIFLVHFRMFTRKTGRRSRRDDHQPAGDLG